MNQAALWAGITLAVFGSGLTGFGLGKDPNAQHMPGSCAIGIFQMAVAIVFFLIAYDK